MNSKAELDRSSSTGGMPYRHAAALTAVFTLTLIAAVWRFRPWMPHTFFGDDLYNYLAYKDGLFPNGVVQALTSTFAEKFRPVFVWLLSTLFGMFGPRVQAYMA